MLKIWGRNNSSNVKKVLWCAKEAGLAYERIDAGQHFGVVDTPAFRALNPNGQVPVLQDGDLVLWESNTIVRYLAARYAAGSLWPIDPAERALVERWMDWATSTFTAPFVTLFLNTVRRPPAERDRAAAEAARIRCGELLAILDAHLADRPYISGQALGIGDIPMGCMAYSWFEMDIVRPELPHLSAWRQRLLQRPAYVEAVCVGLS
jgi:glutathione S-transferase